MVVSESLSSYWTPSGEKFSHALFLNLENELSALCHFVVFYRSGVTIYLTHTCYFLTITCRLKCSWSQLPFAISWTAREFFSRRPVHIFCERVSLNQFCLLIINWLRRYIPTTIQFFCHFCHIIFRRIALVLTHFSCMSVMILTGLIPHTVTPS